MKSQYTTRTNIEFLIIGLAVFIGLGIYGHATGMHIEDAFKSLFKLDLATFTCQSNGYTNCQKDPISGQVTHGSCFSGYVDTGTTCVLPSVTNPPKTSLPTKNACPYGTVKDVSGICVYQQQPQYGQIAVSCPSGNLVNGVCIATGVKQCVFTYNLIQMALDPTCVPISGNNSPALQPQNTYLTSYHTCSDGSVIPSNVLCPTQNTGTHLCPDGSEIPISQACGTQSTSTSNSNIPTDPQVTALQNQITALQNQIQQSTQGQATNNPSATSKQVSDLNQQVASLQSQLQQMQNQNSNQLNFGVLGSVWNLLMAQPIIIIAIVIIIVLLIILVHVLKSPSK